MDSEIARLLDEGYLQRYEQAAREAGYPDVDVVCVLACGMIVQVKEAGLKLRLVCDGSAPHNGESLNATMLVPDTNLTSVDQAAATVGKHSWCFCIDESDAYMQTPCSAWSVRYLGIRWRGVLYAFRVMNFGLSSACSAQQSIAVALHRALRRRLVRSGLHCNPTSGYDQVQVALPPVYEQRQKAARLASKVFKNKHRHLLLDHPALAHSRAHDDDGKLLAAGSVGSAPFSEAAAAADVRVAHRQLDKLIEAEQRAGRRIDTVSGLQQYLDDFWHSASSLRAGVFTLLSALALYRQLRVRCNMKPGKTTYPAQDFTFLGICGSTRTFMLFLDAKRVASMLDAIRVAIDARGITVGDLASLIGLMVFASAVVEARPYYRSLLAILGRYCYDSNGRWCKARKGVFIPFTEVELRDLRAWLVVLRHYNGTDIARGMRRLVAPFELYSDASGTGVAWCYAGHHGVHDIPGRWAKFVFAKKDSHVRILQGRLEAWASLLGLRYAIPRCSGRGMTLRVRSDSSCFIGQARKMSSSDPAVQPVLREIMWLSAVHGVRLEFIHLPASSKEISFVDADSRRTEHDPGGKRTAIYIKGKAEMAALFVKTSRMGAHVVGPLERPDLAPFLEAERCQALAFDTTWSPQRRDALDALVSEWTVPQGPFGRRR